MNPAAPFVWWDALPAVPAGLSREDGGVYEEGNEAWTLINDFEAKDPSAARR